MTISKEDLLSLADALLAGGTESHWRSSVSRAYYAAYHGCDAWHSQLPVPGSNTGPSGGVHQTLINCLTNPAPETKDPFRKTSKVVAIKLNVLKGDRHTADYDLGETMDEARAQRAKILAEEILETLSSSA